MSYEGRDEMLCEDGHLSFFDAMSSPMGMYGDKTSTCHCGKKYVWYTAIDETNGAYCQLHNDSSTCYEDKDDCVLAYPGEVELEIDTPAISEVCNLGHTHITKEETYKIPPIGIGRRIKTE
jgi:hypothetical protein